MPVRVRKRIISPEHFCGPSPPAAANSACSLGNLNCGQMFASLPEALLCAAKVFFVGADGCRRD